MVDMQVHRDSRLDSGLTDAHLSHLLVRFEGRRDSFIATIELPGDLASPSCAISRLVDHALRPTRFVTVIAGPHDGHACVLYFAFGGPSD